MGASDFELKKKRKTKQKKDFKSVQDNLIKLLLSIAIKAIFQICFISTNAS